MLWLVGPDHRPQQSPGASPDVVPGDDLFTPSERRRGLPIGNQTSQFFANVYLDPLDHFVKDRLGLSYVRYVDDFLVFADDKRRLHEVREQIERIPRTSPAPHPPGQDVVFPTGRASASSATGSSRRTGCWPRRTSGASAAGCAGCSGSSRPAGSGSTRSVPGS